MRGNQLARQWKIIRLLESRKRGLTITELSDELDAPVRPVCRDVEALPTRYTIISGKEVLTSCAMSGSYSSL